MYTQCTYTFTFCPTLVSPNHENEQCLTTPMLDDVGENNVYAADWKNNRCDVIIDDPFYLEKYYRIDEVANQYGISLFISEEMDTNGAIRRYLMYFTTKLIHSSFDQ